jgi:hypothetical protein
MNTVKQRTCRNAYITDINKGQPVLLSKLPDAVVDLICNRCALTGQIPGDVPANGVSATKEGRDTDKNRR